LCFYAVSKTTIFDKAVWRKGVAQKDQTQVSSSKKPRVKNINSCEKLGTFLRETFVIEMDACFLGGNFREKSKKFPAKYFWAQYSIIRPQKKLTHMMDSQLRN